MFVLMFWCSGVFSLFVHLPPEYNSPAPTPRLNTNVVPDLQLGTTEWQKYYDDAAQAYYYYNNSSGESSYDRPAFFQVSASCCYYNRLYYDLSLMTYDLPLTYHWWPILTPIHFWSLPDTPLKRKWKETRRTCLLMLALEVKQLKTVSNNRTWKNTILYSAHTSAHTWGTPCNIKHAHDLIQQYTGIHESSQV